MTPKQTSLYWREWAAVRRACKAGALPEPDRHELHVRALGREKSSKLFNNADFDQVLAEFRAISQPTNVTGQVRQQQQPALRMHWRICDALKCLALYPLKEPMGSEGARAYAREILRDKVNRGSWRNVTDIEDLSDRPGSRIDGAGDLVEIPSQVMQLVMDLSRNLNRMRGEAGHTGHQMCMAAGVRCYCARICRKRTPAKMTPLEAAIIAQGNAQSESGDDNEPW